MELYTSYWQNPDLAGLDVIPVVISRGVPRGTLAERLPYRYKRLIDFAPRRDLFERWIALPSRYPNVAPVGQSLLRATTHLKLVMADSTLIEPKRTNRGLPKPPAGFRRLEPTSQLLAEL